MLSFIAVCMTVLFFMFEIKLELPVFAVSSYFMEHRMFVTFSTNAADEITLLFLIGGLALITFSKERQEDETVVQMKYRAMTKALMFNTFFLLFCILFIYGGGFVAMLIINLFSVFILYLGFFYWSKYQSAKHP